MGTIEAERTVDDPGLLAYGLQIISLGAIVFAVPLIGLPIGFALLATGGFHLVRAGIPRASLGALVIGATTTGAGAALAMVALLTDESRWISAGAWLCGGGAIAAYGFAMSNLVRAYLAPKLAGRWRAIAAGAALTGLVGSVGDLLPALLRATCAFGVMTNAAYAQSLTREWARVCFELGDSGE